MIKLSAMTGAAFLFWLIFFDHFFVRHNTVMEEECPDYLEHFRQDVRCKDYQEPDPEE